MASKVILRPRDVRRESNQFHLNNMGDGGWKVRNDQNNGWIRMVPQNTKIKNPNHDPAVHAPDDPNFPLYLEIYQAPN